jgi:citrate lyase beta subunit
MTVTKDVPDAVDAPRKRALEDAFPGEDLSPYRACVVKYLKGHEELPWLVRRIRTLKEEYARADRKAARARLLAAQGQPNVSG